MDCPIHNNTGQDHLDTCWLEASQSQNEMQFLIVNSTKTYLAFSLELIDAKLATQE